jgi:hypothetical protein
MLAGRPERAAGALSRAPPWTTHPIYKYPFFVTRLARVASMASLARPHAAQDRSFEDEAALRAALGSSVLQPLQNGPASSRYTSGAVGEKRAAILLG